MTLTLRTTDGHYVCAEPDGRMVADRLTAGPWETFAVISLDGGQMALLSAHGTYVCAEGGGGGVLVANRGAVGSWERFTSQQVNGGIAVRTVNGHYICAEGGGGQEVNATRSAVGPWETFNAPIPPEPGPIPVPGPGRTGQVKGKVFATEDAGGVWLALGTSFFWGLWGWLHDRERCLANVQAAKDAGIDYLRVFGTVGSEALSDSWYDRRVDCQMPGWATAAAEFTNECQKIGVRVQWTIFGSTSYAPTRTLRQQAVDQLCGALSANPHAVFSVEIGNESWQNGFEGDSGAKELKELAVRARAGGPWLVATTAPRTDSCAAQAPYYKDSACTLGTLHFARTDSGEGGAWRYVRQPWREGTKKCDGQAPLYENNEPKELDGKGDHDTLRVSFSAVVSWQCNVGAYVLHTGAGIRGGGKADLAVGRAANLWEVPGWASVTSALSLARQKLAPDLTNWSRGSSRPSLWEVSDWDAVTRVYESRSGKRFSDTPHNITRPFSLTAKQAMTLSVYHPQTWQALQTVSLSKGEALRLTTSPPAVVILGDLR